MHQLVYLSRVSGMLSSSDIDSILVAAKHHNRAADVTGLLLCDGKRFIQALEGPEAGVASIMERIKTDRRHRDIVYMPVRYVSERQFGSWSMHGRCLNNASEAEAFYRDASALLSNVSSPEVFAAFLGFASMSRAPFRHTGARILGGLDRSLS